MESTINIEAFEQTVRTRRSIRIFDKGPVPDEIVDRCLDLALLAPNSSNLQPYEFYWVRSVEKRQRLVEACLSQAAAATAGELIVCVARTKTWQRNRQYIVKELERHSREGAKIPKAATDYYQRIVPFAYSQGPLGLMGWIKRLIFFVVGFAKPMIRGPKSKHDMQVWAVKTAALACENLMLAFRAFGYDTCPMEGMDERRVHRLLSLARDASVVMVIGAGRRKAEGVTLPHIRGERSWFVKQV
jgi:nitroreductase